MTDAARLRVGDRITRTKYRPATFKVVGWTARDKTILRNVETGAELTGWWPTRASLPRHYVLDEAHHNELVARGFDPDWTVSPGEILRDWMEENGLPSAKVVASCCRGLEEKDVAGVLAGTRRINKVLATKLSVATGISAQFWLNLERHFRRGLAEGKHWDGPGG